MMLYIRSIRQHLWLHTRSGPGLGAGAEEPRTHGAGAPARGCRGAGRGRPRGCQVVIVAIPRRIALGASDMDVVSPARRSAMMARIQGRDTKPEMVVRRAAHRLGYQIGRAHV